MIDADRLAAWKKRIEEWRGTEAYSSWQDERGRRAEIRDELLPLVRGLLAGEATAREFRDAFTDRAYGSRDYFGNRSRSAGMFLSKLVAHLPDPDAVTAELRQALQVPADPGEATARLRAFTAFLEVAIEAGEATRNDLQPARALFH